jgi:hypothetical protein
MCSRRHFVGAELLLPLDVEAEDEEMKPFRGPQKRQMGAD